MATPLRIDFLGFRVSGSETYSATTRAHCGLEPKAGEHTGKSVRASSIIRPRRDWSTTSFARSCKDGTEACGLQRTKESAAGVARELRTIRCGTDSRTSVRAR